LGPIPNPQSPIPNIGFKNLITALLNFNIKQLIF
jgi:hypothetical protein